MNLKIAGTIILLVAFVMIFGVAKLARSRPEQKTEMARQAQLRQALASIRAALREHKTRTGSSPSELNNLIASGTLKTLPLDPVTGSHNSWTVLREESVRVDDFQKNSAGNTGAFIAVSYTHLTLPTKRIV